MNSNDNIPKDEMLLAEALTAQYRPLRPRGHMKNLRVSALLSGCGDIKLPDGVSLAFENEGCWVVTLDDLRDLVAGAEAARRVRYYYERAMEES